MMRVIRDLDLLVTLLLVTTASPILASSRVTMQKIVFFDKICQTAIKWNFSEATLPITCVQYCLETIGCYGVFYNKYTAYCAGSDVIPTLSGRDGCDYQEDTSYYSTVGYGRGCNTYGDCEFPNLICRSGMCVCAQGYSMDPTAKGCVKECDNYGTSFQKSENTKSLDLTLLTAVATDNDVQCKQRCVGEALCKSVDYTGELGVSVPTHNCILYSSTGDVTGESGTTHYQRDCA